MSKKILVIGELNSDLIVTGLASFPAPGRETVCNGMKRVMGSSSAICAAGLARLGASVDLLGKVGTDADGHFVTDQLRALGVGTSLVMSDPAFSTGATVSLSYAGDRALVTFRGCISNLKLVDIDLTILQQYQHLHVSSYFLQTGLQPGLLTLFCYARQRGLTVSLDPGSDPAEEWQIAERDALLDQIDLLLLNEREACAITGTDQTRVALRKLSEYAQQVVIKCGAAGAMTMHDENVLSHPGLHVQAIDTTGAGDSFDAGFIYARLVRNLPLAQALEFANACGALATTGVGGTAAQPTQVQLNLFLQQLNCTRFSHSPTSGSSSFGVCGQEVSQGR